MKKTVLTIAASLMLLCSCASTSQNPVPSQSSDDGLTPAQKLEKHDTYVPHWMKQ